MILAILFAWFGYKKASATGRNGILWAVIAGGTFIGTQLIVSLAMGILLGLILGMNGGTDKDIDIYSIPITIVAIVASIISVYLVLRYLDKVPEDNTYISPPPPPKF